MHGNEKILIQREFLWNMVPTCTKYKNVWVYYPSKQMCLLLETLPKDAHTWLVVRGPCDMDKVAFIKEDQLCFQQCLLFTALPELRTHNTIYY